MKRPAKLIANTVLAGSLLAVLSGCASGDTTAASPAPAPSATATQAPEQEEESRATFVQVIDGDTIEVKPVSMENGDPTGEPNFNVRILGMAAPEGCGSEEALKYFGDLLLPGQYMMLSYEPTLEDPTDEEGNVLAYVSRGGSGDAENVGRRMVNSGYATAWYPEGEQPSEKFQDYVEAGEGAKRSETGIWSTCDPAGA